MISTDGINILLVDDRPENLLALEAIIDRDEYNLIKAYSGEEALKFLLKYDFAAILLDVQMPGIDGFGTAKIIKAREKTKNIPILFITANNMDSEHVFTGYSLGAIDYILKPFDPLILKAKVEGFVELYKMKQQLVLQAETLAEKTKELEIAYAGLSEVTAELRVSEELANVISETSIDSMIIINEKGKILKANPAVEHMFNYERDEVIGNGISLLFSCDHSQTYINTVLETIHFPENPMGSDHLKEVNGKRKDGTLFPAEIQIGKRYVHDRYIVACTIRDISKNKDYQKKIEYMAYHDSLTELPNRRSFNDRLSVMLNHAKRTNQPLVMMYLDMDRFKYINDSLGHIVGDKILQKIAGRLKAGVRTDDFAARIGGDEFNIILPETNREQALELAESILHSLNQPFYIDNYELYITACIGISVFPYDGEDTLSLMKNADAALYRAKEQGKNLYKVFHSGMNIQSYKAFIMQNDLRKAIERNEFQLVYQPRINIESDIVTGAEALLRWYHPTWGTISPEEFIPLAEESGQIAEIGEWVLRSACKQLKTWHNAGLQSMRMAVNFSAQQFLQKDLIQSIEGILSETDVNPNMLEIEITESVIIGNESNVAQALNQLRNMGISISIDDFGTGYSSLNYLRSFPVNTLKIDKSFIRDVTENPSASQALVSTIISLAHHLNMTVCAEGVETEAQLNMLRKFKCEEIQGYLFSPPVGPEKFEAFLLQNEEKNSIKRSKDGSFENMKASQTSTPLMNEFEMKTGISENEEILQAAFERTKKIYSISTREMDVFHLLVKGFSNKEISGQLFISEHTVKNHITRIFQKLTVNDRLQAMAKIYQACMEEGKGIQPH
ncbi:EAL domain-containing protein [Cytobacillus oceanisediminis]|uniref:EAL domain-containing protein n=1 Tax=Cytobacillus oceanisediminis TaxID=665099 RepID=UPI0037352AC9